MTREQLALLHEKAVLRYWRALADSDGRVPHGLLSELGEIAAAHAEDESLAAARRRHPAGKAKA